MKRFNHLNSIALVTVLTMISLMVFSCRNGRSNDSNTNATVNTKIDHDVDSVIYVATMNHDEERMLHLIDSFQNAGRMNTMWADMLRARFYTNSEKHAEASK